MFAFNQVTKMITRTAVKGVAMAICLCSSVVLAYENEPMGLDNTQRPVPPPICPEFPRCNKKDLQIAIATNKPEKF
jgi:hypothetical protein